MPTPSKAAPKPAAKTKSAATTVKKTAKSAAAPKAAPAKPVAAKKPAATKKPASRASAGKARQAVAPDQRRYYIEVAAYYIAERRGFNGGSELADWVQAEAEIDRLLQEGVLNPSA